MVSHFFVPPRTTHLTIHLTQKTDQTSYIHWLCYDNNIPLLNAMKILTMQSVRNLKNFESIYIPVFCLTAGLPACLP